MNKMKTLLRTLWEDEAGVSLAEYVLLVVLICAAAIAGMTFLGATSENTTHGFAPGPRAG